MSVYGKKGLKEENRGRGKWDTIMWFLNSICCSHGVQLSAYNYLFKDKKQFLPYYFCENLPTATKVIGTEKNQHVSAFLCGGKRFLDKKVSLTDSKSFH